MKDEKFVFRIIVYYVDTNKTLETLHRIWRMTKLQDLMIGRV
jgi:hypothetical protein